MKKSEFLELYDMEADQKGVSTIIAALLLIAIVVAAGILFYGFSAGLLNNMQTGGGTQMKDQLELENYNWQTITTITLSVRNVGTTPLNLVTADYSLNGVQASTPTFSTCQSPMSLQPTGACTITLLASGFTVNSGQAYSVKIALADGALFEYSCTAGQVG